MANRRRRNLGGSRPHTPSQLSKEVSAQLTSPEQGSPSEKAEQQDTSTTSRPPSVNTNVKTYVPSPPSGSVDALSQSMAKLSEYQREAISQFVSATKEPISVAIDTLIACEWDLIEAASCFTGDSRDDDDDDDGDTAREDLQEGTRALTRAQSRRGSDVREWVHEETLKAFRQHKNAGTLRHSTLRLRLLGNKQEWPQNPQNVAHEPIALHFSPSSPSTHTIPRFISPYGERKL